MAKTPYLMRLAARLTAGLASLPAARRERHREFFLAQQRPDGGFAGRDGESDLYYTSFAVRGLTLLDRLDPEQGRRIGAFLKAHALQRLNLIDLTNWLATAAALQVAGEDLWAEMATSPEQMADQLEQRRADDGGYAKTVQGTLGSTYHSFLAATAYELLGQSVPKPNALVQFIYDRQREDGGFVEIDPMKRSGTNPTAAAVALLQIFGYVDEELREDVGGFLTDVRSPEGGFQANTRVPFADGLSTFTGLLTVRDLGLEELIDPARAQSFVTEILERPEGGFRAASWDEQADVEYTFYGLAILGLLSSGKS